MMGRNLFIIAALPLALVACGDNARQEDLTTDDEIEGLTNAQDPSLVNVEGEVVAVEDGESTPPPPMLQPIGDEPSIALGGATGACAFRVGNAMLFAAGAKEGDRARAKGVIQIEAEDMLLEGDMTGGTDYLEKGPSMTDGTYSVELRRGPGVGTKTAAGTEYPATLAVRSGLGPERRYAGGTWTCGG